MKPILPAFVLLVVLAVSPSWGQSTEYLAPVRLRDFVDGVSFEKRERLIVRDIRIGNVSVQHLFHEQVGDLVTAREYYFGKDAYVDIRLKDEQALADLREILRPPGRPSFILVDLEDPRKSWLRSLYERTQIVWPEVDFKRTVKIPVLDPCDRVTRIIYKKIDSMLKNTVKGQTEEPLSLSSVFDSLLADKEDLILARLDPIEPVNPKNTCLTTMELINWLEDKNAHGFKKEEYSVTPEIRAILAILADSLTSVRNWTKNDISVRVVGYADPTPVKGIPLDGRATGVQTLEKAPLSLRVVYGGCSGDHLLGVRPRYFSWKEKGAVGQVVGSTLKSNCELGAVRAYVATALLAESLGGADVEYEYATGGVAGDTTNEAEKRRIDISITVKAAKEELPAESQ